jgi:hypothetical protein
VKNQRTLVCVFAQTREHELTWSNFKKNVLDALNADLAVCIAVPEGYDYSNPFWQHAKYKWTTPEYDNWMDAFQRIIDIDYPNIDNSWKKALSINGNWISPLNGDPAGGAIQIFFRWFLWYSLREDNVIDKYDRIVFTRSDYMFVCPHPPMDLLDPKNIWIPNGEFYGGVTDRHAVLSKSNAEGYLTSIVKHMFTNTDKFCEQSQVLAREWDCVYDPDTYQKPDKLVKFGLEMSVRLGLDLEFPPNTVKFFPYIMHLLRSANGKSRHNYGILDEELGYYIKCRPEMLLSKHFKEYIKTPADWYGVGRHLL